MNSRRFHQAGMKKCKVGNEEMEAELMQEGMLDIRNFDMALRKFRNHSENFAIPAKFRYAQFFRYDSEISLS